MIPTRKQSFDISEKCEAFYRTEIFFQGYQIEMYDYRLATYNDFKDNNAFELRGLTYVFNIFTNQWDTFPGLQKFFNVDQCQDWLYNDLKNKKISIVQDKLDGSMIHPIRLPDGRIFLKSKMSLESPQAVEANKIYSESKNLQEFISFCFDSNLEPIFEYTSYNNQIVLQYDKPELSLIQIRDRTNGAYFNLNLFKKYNINIATKKDNLELYSLETLLELKTTETEIEGWVITFEDGQKAKIKTDWYLKRHGLITELREDSIIELTLNGEIDDVISISTGQKREFIEKISKITSEKFNHLVNEYKELRRKFFQDFKEDKKEFAKKYSKEKLFPFVMKELNSSFRDIEQIAEKRVKEVILKDTYRLFDAKKWIEE